MLLTLPEEEIMSQSASPSKLKFLLDENVKRRLEEFLVTKGFDVMLAPKGISNGKLAALSKSEKQVLVTNDSHFTDPFVFPKDKIFSVVWLRVPQRKIESLINSFSKLLKDKSKPADFEGFLTELREEGSFKSYPIKSSKFVNLK